MVDDHKMTVDHKFTTVANILQREFLATASTWYVINIIITTHLRFVDVCPCILPSHNVVNSFLL